MTTPIANKAKNNKITVLMIILNVVIFLLIALLNYFYLTVSASKAEHHGFSDSIFINPATLTFVALGAQIIFTTILNQRFLKNKKQIVLVNISVFIISALVIILSLVPAILNVHSCRVPPDHLPSGECMTLIENSKVQSFGAALGLIYLFIYSVANISVNVLLLSKRKKSKGEYIKKIWIPIALAFLIVFLIMVAFPILIGRRIKQNSDVGIQTLPENESEEIEIKSLEDDGLYND